MKKRILLIIGTIILAVLVFVLYFMMFAKKNLAVYNSPDSDYQLIISQMGDPSRNDSTTCSLQLNRGNKKISKADALIFNKREEFDESSFLAKWNDTNVQVQVNSNGSRLADADQTYTMLYNGDVKQEESKIEELNEKIYTNQSQETYLVFRSGWRSNMRVRKITYSEDKTSDARVHAFSYIWVKFPDEEIQKFKYDKNSDTLISTDNENEIFRKIDDKKIAEYFSE